MGRRRWWAARPVAPNTGGSMHDQLSFADIAWAAGLFEGEGCFSTYGTAGRRGCRCQLRLAMNDLDVVERFAGIIGCGKIRLRKRHRENWGDTWEWYLCRASQVVPVIEMLLPWMGKRRTVRALEVLEVARQICPRNERTHCPKGHLYNGDNLLIESIVRNGRSYQARRCKICRRTQERERMRRNRGITSDRYRM